jgi:hypothetical protein
MLTPIENPAAFSICSMTVRANRRADERPPNFNPEYPYRLQIRRTVVGWHCQRSPM